MKPNCPKAGTGLFSLSLLSDQGLLKFLELKKSVGLDVVAVDAAEGVSQGEGKKSGTLGPNPIPAAGEALNPGPEGLPEIGQGLVFNC